VKIAIIGTGNVGQALGSSLLGAGHQVTFAARDAAKTREVAASVGAAGRAVRRG
jgi:3-hydroxyisobutyrate dehydrogenase-like beta-hydroxyacid dehydrogenase